MFSKAGSFNLNKAVGAQAITGLGFQPKAILVWTTSVHVWDVNTTNEVIYSMGAATGPAARWCHGAAWWGRWGYTNDRLRTDRILTCNDSSDATYMYIAADLTSFDADGFTINITDYARLDANDTVVVHYMAFGGADLLAKAGSYSIPDATTGNKAVTGVGFQPKALITGWGRSNTFEGANGNSGVDFGTGYAVSPTKQMAQWLRINEGNVPSASSGNSPVYVGQLTDAMLLRTDSAGAITERANLVSMDADGWTMNVTTRVNAGSLKMGYLAFGGVDIRTDFVTFNQPTATGNQSVTLTNITPKATFFTSMGKVAGGTITNGVRLLHGAATSATNEDGSSFAGLTASIATTNPNDANSTTKALIFAADATANTTVAEGDITTYGGALNINWTKVDATARQIGVLAIGEINSTTEARIHQTALEVLSDPSPPARVHQVALEVLAEPVNPNARLNQQVVEAVILQTNPEMRVHQQVVEIIRTNGVPIPGPTATMTATVGDVGCRASAAVVKAVPVAFADWLNNHDAIRCVLVEVDVESNGQMVTRYLSNRLYTSGAADTPANTLYMTGITGGITYSEKLPLNGQASLSFGDIEVNNTEGDFDAWLGDIWKNQRLRVYMGDVRWNRSQFVQVLEGVVADLDAKSRNRLNIKLRDKMERLNSPVVDEKVGGEHQNKDNSMPAVFGEVHNVTPVLTDPYNEGGEYRMHKSYIERVIEVRDNGVPVAFSGMLDKGSFRLTSPPVGVVTASVQGDVGTSYENTVGDLIERITTAYGKEMDRLIPADLDSRNFTVFKSKHLQPVGIWLGDRTNVITVCQQLAASVGAQIIMSRLGQLRILKIQPPGPNDEIVTTITAADMYDQTIEIAERPDVAAAVKVGYAKNWSIQNNLLTSIPEEHKNLFAETWLSATANDNTVATKYRLYEEPQIEETMLLVAADAQVEADRRLNIRKVQRTVYRFDGLPRLLTLELGDYVTLQHSRFGLSAGKNGQVISLQPEWVSGHVKVEVLV